MSNDGSLGADVAIKLFDIGFDSAKYRESSLKVVTSATNNGQWTETILSSVPGDPAAYSSFSSSTGILPGQSVSGFAVEFVWIGAGTPQANVQPFQVYDPVTFARLAQGNTGAQVQAANVENIPTLSEWGMILLMMLMAALAYRELKRNRSFA